MAEPIHQLVTPVRMAGPADEAGIFDLFVAMHKEHGESGFAADKVNQTIHRFVGEQGGIIGVIGAPQDLRACICLLLDTIWFSQEHHLSVLFDFVRADSRSGKFGYKRALINYAKTTSDALEIPFTTGIFTNAATTDNLEAKLRIYSSLLPKAGEFYKYIPKGKASGEIAP
jgi:hypothetical protein